MTDVRILTDDLGGSPLSRLLQSGAAPTGWLPAAPRGAAEWRARAAARQGEGDWAARLRALAPAFEATGAAKARLDRVISGGGVVVTTGQQPGLFGGPVYTWSKAMSALALADALERETGIPTAAVYWAATDDADFAEASSTVVSRPGGV
jgi:bacillithiol synthase